MSDSSPVTFITHHSSSNKEWRYPLHLSLQGYLQAWWSLPTSFCLWVTRKYCFLHQTYTLSALDLKGLAIMGSQLLFLEHNFALPYRQESWAACVMKAKNRFSMTKWTKSSKKLSIIPYLVCQYFTFGLTFHNNWQQIFCFGFGLLHSIYNYKVHEQEIVQLQMHTDSACSHKINLWTKFRAFQLVLAWVWPTCQCGNNFLQLSILEHPSWSKLQVLHFLSVLADT